LSRKGEFNEIWAICTIGYSTWLRGPAIISVLPGCTAAQQFGDCLLSVDKNESSAALHWAEWAFVTLVLCAMIALSRRRYWQYGFMVISSWVPFAIP
jgi:hypothetical protein